jgi:hypothetical protein
VRASTRAGMIVPSPASRKINLKSHITTQTLACYACYRSRLDPPDNSCSAHIRPQLPVLIVDRILCFRADVVRRISTAELARAPGSFSARLEDVPAANIALRTTAAGIRLVRHPCSAGAENLFRERGA